MIDKVRSHFIQPSRYYIDEYNNPYLSKLSIKMIPNVHHQSGLISPFSAHNSFGIAQCLPLIRDDSIRVALLWQQNIQPRFNQSQLGFSFEYKIIQKWRAKLRLLFGSTCFVSTQLHRSLPHHLELMVGCESMFQKSYDFHTIKCGIRKGRFTVNAANRINLGSNLNFTYNRKLIHDIDFEIRGDSQLNDINSGKLETGISYKVNNSVTTYALVCLNDASLKWGIKFQVEKRFSKYGNLILSIQYVDQKSVICFGYRSPSFTFVMPIIATESITSIVKAGLAFIIGFFIRDKSQKNKNSIKSSKTTKMKQQQLKLINEKAAQIYNKQKSVKGLVIEEGYSGPRQILLRFKNLPNRAVEILRNPEFKDIVFDVTIALRFYTSKGQLKIPKGNKNSLLGYYGNAQDSLYILYTKNEEKKELMIDGTDKIQIKME